MKFDVDNYFEESVGRPKIDQRGPNRDPEGSLARPPRARQAPSWMPGGPPRCPLWPILPPGVKTLKIGGVSEFRRRLVAKTYREEKAISSGQIPLGRSPPGWGDHRHRHHHRHGHHR